MAFDISGTRTFRTGAQWLRNKASTELNRINNPIVRSGIGSIVNAIDPGILGGTQFSDANVFRSAFDQRAIDLNEELNKLVTPSASITSDTDNLKDGYDWRARLRPKNGGAERFYAASSTVDGGFDDNLMRPIQESNGLVWMHTPTLMMSSSANYAEHLGQGQQYKINTYQNSQTAEFSLLSQFTANDIYEARYMLAMMAFMKTTVKGYFGDNATATGTAGSPPPVMIFEYLGEHGFWKVPVVVQNYTINYPNNVDYVPVELNHGNEGTVTYVPTVAEVSCVLTPQYTPRKIRSKYDIQGIANGRDYQDGFI